MEQNVSEYEILFSKKKKKCYLPVLRKLSRVIAQHFIVERLLFLLRQERLQLEPADLNVRQKENLNIHIKNKQ